MKFLIIGASGFVGRYILRYAREAGHDAVGTYSHGRRADLERFDLTHDRLAAHFPRSWFDNGGQVFVVVSAAIPQPDRCKLERELAFATNVTGTARALHDAVELGATPVFLSSSFVFDGKRGNYADRDARAPISEYGRHKAQIEELVETKMPAGLVLRLDKTIGDDPSEHHLLTEWWKLAQQGREIRCITGQDFSVTLVDDVARAVVAACERRLAGTFNVASPEHFTRIELARRFLACAGMSVPLVDVPQEELGFADPRSLVSWLDSAALTRATGVRFTSTAQIFASFLKKVGVAHP